MHFSLPFVLFKVSFSQAQKEKNGRKRVNDSTPVTVKDSLPVIKEDHDIAVSPVEAITAPAGQLGHADVMTRPAKEVLQFRGDKPPASERR